MTFQLSFYGMGGKRRALGILQRILWGGLVAGGIGPTQAYAHDFQAWSTLQITKQLGPEWEIFFLPAVRMRENASELFYHEFRQGVCWRQSKNLTLGLNYLYARNKSSGKPLQEHTGELDVTPEVDLGPFVFSLRGRQAREIRIFPGAVRISCAPRTVDNTEGAVDENPRQRRRVLDKRNPLATEYQSIGDIGSFVLPDVDSEGVNNRARFSIDNPFEEPERSRHFAALTAKHSLGPLETVFSLSYQNRFLEEIGDTAQVDQFIDDSVRLKLAFDLRIA